MTLDDKDLPSAVREDFVGVRMNTAAGTILTDDGSLRRGGTDAACTRPG